MASAARDIPTAGLISSCYLPICRSCGHKPLRGEMKHTLVGLSVVAAAVGCATESPPPAPEASAEPSAAVVPAATSGRGAAERFVATWNTRDSEQWAGSLNYPHARPSAAGYRVWPTRQAYVDTADFERVIATGWDHTCRSHGGPYRWVRPSFSCGSEAYGPAGGATPAASITCMMAAAVSGLA